MAGGLECVVVIDGRTAGLLRFRDSPRADGATFVSHLKPAHGLTRVMLVSGDRESEVRWLADIVGIKEVHAGIQPEGKLRLVEEATKLAPTVFVGDGINDAPALAAATVGIAMGTASDVTSEAAGAVVMDSSGSTSFFTSAGGCGTSRCKARSVAWPRASSAWASRRRASCPRRPAPCSRRRST